MARQGSMGSPARPGRFGTIRSFDDADRDLLSISLTLAVFSLAHPSLGAPVGATNVGTKPGDFQYNPPPLLGNARTQRPKWRPEHVLRSIFQPVRCSVSWMSPLHGYTEPGLPVLMPCEIALARQTHIYPWAAVPPPSQWYTRNPRHVTGNTTLVHLGVGRACTDPPVGGARPPSIR